MTRFKQHLGNTAGFTLIEIIVAIVLLGIAVPTLTVYFSGIGDSKVPEYQTEGVFLGTNQFERITDASFNRIPTAGTYTCTAFRDWAITNATAPENYALNIDCTNTDYDFNFTVSLVAPDDVDTSGSGGWGKRVVMTLSRFDGEMPTFQLVNLY